MGGTGIYFDYLYWTGRSSDAGHCLARSTILDVIYQPSPGQLVQAAFGTTSATLNYDCYMLEIESKILRVVQERIFKNVFLAVAPNYTDLPEVALKHVYQIVTDKDGKKTCR